MPLPTEARPVASGVLPLVRRGTLDTCHNALGQHVAGGRADQAALIYDSPVTRTTRTLTYRELRDDATMLDRIREALQSGR